MFYCHLAKAGNAVPCKRAGTLFVYIGEKPGFALSEKGCVQEKDSFSLYEIELIPDSDTPEKSLMDEEYQVLVQQAIDSLPPKCREVFRLVLSDKLKNPGTPFFLGNQ